MRAESRMSSIVVSGIAGQVHLSRVASIRSLAFSRHCSFCSCESWVGGGGVYGGGRAADRRISVGESSEEWLMMRTAMRTVTVMNREWEYCGVCSIVGVSKADWGCGRWIVEVYK